MNAIAQFWRDFSSWVKGRRRFRRAPSELTLPELIEAYAQARRSHHGQGRAYERLRAARHAALLDEWRQRSRS